MKRGLIALWGLAVLHCAAGQSSSAPQAVCVPPPVTGASAAAPRGPISADVARVNALHLPEAPGPCEKDADCFKEDPCFNPLCIEHQCTGQVLPDRFACNFPLSNGELGRCYSGRCLAGPPAPNTQPEPN